MSEQTVTERPLQQLAVFAVQHAIRGSSFKRNSLLKPFDIILQELDCNPRPGDKQQEEPMLRAATKQLIFDHLERIARDEEHAPGKTKMSKVDQYVDLFFDGVLFQLHDGDVNALLDREKFLRAAYLYWVRQALAKMFVSKGLAKDIGQATDELQKEEENEDEAGAGGTEGEEANGDSTV
jgi:hypothetical protein